MFLNYKRIPLAYILLSIFTLGFYSAVYRKEVATDINIAFGEKRQELPGFKFVILNLITLGVYSAFWDLKFLKLCEEYIVKNGGENTVDYETYRFLSLIPIVRYASVRSFVAQINEACRIYSEKQLEDVDTHDLTDVVRVRDVNVDDIYVSEAPARVIEYDFSEERKQIEKERAEEEGYKPDLGDTRMIAGHAVVEEYDPSRDYRRIGYQLRFEREEKAEREEEAKKITEVENEPVEQETVTSTVDVIKCKRGKAWFTKVVAAMLLVFIIPFAMIAVTIFALPSVYEDTYVGALNDKYELLNSKDEKNKIIIIGGSSVALGIDSELIEYELDKYDVVNFGLTSELGTKIMLDLSRGGINEGDIIVIAPEFNERSMSLYFDGYSALQALDGNLGMLMQIEPEDYSSLIGSSLQFSAEKIGYLMSGKAPVSTRPAYQKDNFNSNGDNVYGRPYNETFGLYNEISFDFKARMKDNTVTPYEEYITYINEYTHYAERKGATVYYSFAPISSAVVSVDAYATAIDDYYENLCNVLQCRVISSVYNYILDEGYFYDNEYNLNDAGVKVRTLKLIDDIKRELKDDSNNLDSETEKAPGYIQPPVTVETDEDISFAQDFFFERYTLKNGDTEVTYYSVCGLTELGMMKDRLTVPNMYEGIPVVRISPSAFKSCTNLVSITLGKNTVVLAQGCFEGSSITSVYIPDDMKPESVFVPSETKYLTEGSASGLTFYVSKTTYDSFLCDIGFWSKYSRYIAVKP